MCIVAHVMTRQSPPVKISKKFMLVGLHTKQLALCINYETIRVLCVTEFCTFRYFDNAMLVNNAGKVNLCILVFDIARVFHRCTCVCIQKPK